jgi:NADPH-dependent 2,4-dienoyl-CoA reductase/sulfur reductase-like enzyme
MTGKLGAEGCEGKIDALVIGSGPAGLMAAETWCGRGGR